MSRPAHAPGAAPPSAAQSTTAGPQPPTAATTQSSGQLHAFCETSDASVITCVVLEAHPSNANAITMAPKSSADRRFTKAVGSYRCARASILYESFAIG